MTTRSLRLIAGTVIAAGTVGLVWLTPAVYAGISFNGID
jgi:hypothetical protein